MVAACDISRGDGGLGGLTDAQSVQPISALSDADRQKFCAYVENIISTRFTDDEIRRGVCLRSGGYSAFSGSPDALVITISRCEQRYLECMEETPEEKARDDKVTFVFCEEKLPSTCDITPAAFDHCLSVEMETLREVAELGTCEALLSGDNWVDVTSPAREACDLRDYRCDSDPEEQ